MSQQHSISKRIREAINLVKTSREIMEQAEVDAREQEDRLDIRIPDADVSVDPGEIQDLVNLLEKIKNVIKDTPAKGDLRSVGLWREKVEIAHHQAGISLQKFFSHYTFPEVESVDFIPNKNVLDTYGNEVSKICLDILSDVQVINSDEFEEAALHKAHISPEDTDKASEWIRMLKDWEMLRLSMMECQSEKKSEDDTVTQDKIGNAYGLNQGSVSRRLKRPRGVKDIFHFLLVGEILNRQLSSFNDYQLYSEDYEYLIENGPQGCGYPIAVKLITGPDGYTKKILRKHLDWVSFEFDSASNKIGERIKKHLPNNPSTEECRNVVEEAIKEQDTFLDGGLPVNGFCIPQKLGAKVLFIKPGQDKLDDETYDGFVIWMEKNCTENLNDIYESYVQMFMGDFNKTN